MTLLVCFCSGSCQKSLRTGFSCQRGVTEVAVGLDSIITSILIRPVSFGAGRGLTTQKGNEAINIPFFTAVFWGCELDKKQWVKLCNIWSWNVSAQASASWMVYVVFNMKSCVLLCMYGRKCSVFVSLPPHCLKSALTFWHQRYFLSSCLDRVKHSTLCSIILSHPAKAVALGGSVKNFISNHGYICLLSVVLGFSSSMIQRLGNQSYDYF